MMDWTMLLTLGMQIVVFILQRVNASAATIAAFQKLVDSAKDDGLISQQASDKFSTLHEQLMAKFKENKNETGSTP